MKTSYLLSGATLIMAVLLGCEEEPKVTATDAAQPEVPAAVKKIEPSAEERKAAEEKAARQAEAEKAEAALAENPLTDCCRALSKQTFTLRSAEYQGAATACGVALTEKKDLASVLPEIKKALKDKPLPEECAKK